MADNINCDNCDNTHDLKNDEKVEKTDNTHDMENDVNVEETDNTQETYDIDDEKVEENDNKNLGEFRKIVNEFLTDLLVTFPDKILDKLNDNLKSIISTKEDEEDKTADNDALTEIYAHCSLVLPERFFDVLYQNQDIFSNPEIDCCFLPGIDFKELWVEDISDKTRESIWKYLQLLLFSIVTNVENKTSFGKTAELFEAIDETEFKDKLEDTIRGLESMFGSFGQSDADNQSESESTPSCDIDSSKNLFGNVPNPQEIQDHINGIMNGKLGNLAKELAEETAKDFDLTGENITDVKDVFQTLFKNPQKLMNLVKNVGSKLDEKMKSGDIKESELLEEATSMFNNMKNMPGMPSGSNMAGGAEGMQDLFNNFNIPELMKNMGMMPGNAKFNQNAFNAKMQENLKTSKTKERMRARLEQNKQAQQAQQAEQAQQAQQLLTDTPQKSENIQSNIQKNLDFILNNKGNNNQLTVLNDSLQTLVEQMKIQNNESQLPQLQNDINPKKRKSKHKKG